MSHQTLKYILCALFGLLGVCHLALHAQNFPSERLTDWSNAGLSSSSSTQYETIDVSDYGIIPSEDQPINELLSDILNEITQPTKLYFPKGKYLLNKSLNIPSNVIIKGAGAHETVLIGDLGGSGHMFSAKGSEDKESTTYLTKSILKDDHTISVENTASYNVGDYIRIHYDDSYLITSSWAKNSTGQIFKITSIDNNIISVQSPARKPFLLKDNPFIQRLNPVKNIGIECLKLERKDNTAPQQSANIFFDFVVDSWISGVESENCTFSHITLSHAANIVVSNSYFHHGFDYGGGGRAYGVALQFNTSDCLIENNIFEFLRHSMLLQAGANGNVFTYNYSTNVKWNSYPHDAAGDIVLHGNYPYMNLFEQNIVQNMVIDNSHGKNGPYNTFFRNRGEKFGIFFSANNSPSQNFIGNEITNTKFPYSTVNYTIQGTDHYEYGNNNKGLVTPANTAENNASSLFYSKIPKFLMFDQYGKIGFPSQLNQYEIHSLKMYESSAISDQLCSDLVDNNTDSSNQSTTITSNLNVENSTNWVSPNPFNEYINLNVEADNIRQLTIRDQFGKLIYHKTAPSKIVSTHHLPNGMYYVTIELKNTHRVQSKMVKL